VIRLCSVGVVALSLLFGAGCHKAPAASTAPAAAAQAAPASSAQPTLPMPPKPVPAQLPDVIARVNGEAVTKVEFDRLINNMEQSGGQKVPAERRDEILRGAIDQLVTYTVLAQEVKARNIVIADAEIDGDLKQMQAQFPNEEEFKKALAGRGMTIDRLRSDARVEIAINKMMEAEVANQPAVTDAQAREFYDKNPDKFKQNEAVRASHILIKVDEKADAATKKRALAEARSVLKQARAGADFAALAKKHSQDGSAAQGGDLDFFSHGQMVAPFDQAAFALKPGQISGIVTTPFGYHIIKVTDRRPASTVSVEQANERIKQYLTEQHKQEHAQAFIEGLKKKAKIEVLI
jgi:peptidyl-prolyl cis-trans isomerase C